MPRPWSPPASTWWPGPSSSSRRPRRRLAGGRLHRRLHRLHGRHHRRGAERHQARPGLLHHQPARLHDAGAGRGRRTRPGIFHLITHAFFKALLFLGAGSVIHAVHTNDIWHMGGLGRAMKITAATAAFGALALAGICPFSGFFSKDEILAAGRILLAAGRAACRPLFAARPGHRVPHRLLHVRGSGCSPSPAPRARTRSASSSTAPRSPAVMTVPLSSWPRSPSASGWFGPARLRGLLRPARRRARRADRAARRERPRPARPARHRRRLGQLPARRVAPRTAPAWTGLNRFLADKWYIDSRYQWFATHVMLGASALFAWVDRHVVNGFVDGSAWLAGRVGRGAAPRRDGPAAVLRADHLRRRRIAGWCWRRSPRVGPLP